MNDLYKEIYTLFSRRWDEDLTEEQEDALDDKADELIEKYGWDAVYETFKSYLIRECSTPELSVNAAYIFWDFCWYNYPIHDPYEFMSYFYYRIDFNTKQYDASDILDSLTTTVLPKNGISAADLMKHPYYMPESDPEMIAAAERWKNK